MSSGLNIYRCMPQPEIPIRVVWYLLWTLFLSAQGFCGESGKGTLRDLYLIRTSCASLKEANSLVLDIRRMGGSVGVIVSPGLLLGWIPVESRNAVGSLDQVRSLRPTEDMGAKHLAVPWWNVQRRFL